MLVILKENVQNLGRMGELVKVPDGYARNFLIPKKLVVPANEKNVASIEHNKKILDKKREVQLEAAKKVAEKLSAVVCQISKKVGANDKIFGSVSTADIAVELEKAGFPTDKKWIQLSSPIKALGKYTATVQLDGGLVEASVQVVVTQEG